MGAQDLTASYGYDERNRLSTWTWGGETEHFGYDELGNMTHHGVGGPVVPGPGGNKNQSFSADHPHRVVWSTQPFRAGQYGLPTLDAHTYDADGNLASEQLWDVEWVNGENLGSTVAPPTSFEFDSWNRLVGQTHDGQSWLSGVESIS